MPRESPLIHAFNAGEWSALMDGRTDQEKYDNACRIVENFIVLPQGPATRTPGTLYIADAGDHAKEGRLKRFEFNVEQAYQLGLEDEAMLFYKDDAQIALDATGTTLINGGLTTDLTGWSDKSTGTGATAWNAADGGRANLAAAGSGNVAAIEQQVTVQAADLNKQHAIAFAVRGDRAGDTLKLRIGNSSGGTELVNDVAFDKGFAVYTFTPTVSPIFVRFLCDESNTVGVNDIEIAADGVIRLQTPWAEDEVGTVKTAQSTDQMWMVHPSYPPMRLERTAHERWNLVEVLFLDGPYLEENAASGKTLAPSGTSGAITITAAGHAPFVATDVGRLVRIKHSTTQGYAIITGFTSTTVVSADVLSAFGATTAQVAWRLGLWSTTTGFPADVTFHEQRLVFIGAAIARPGAVGGSKVGDFETHTPGTTDDDAFLYNIAADQVSAGRWMVSTDNGLLIGMPEAEFKLGPATDNGTITPSSVKAGPATSIGSADVDPVRVNEVVLFVQRHGRQLIEIVFDALDGFKAPDLAMLAEHMTASGLVEMAHQKQPFQTVWMCRVDGQLIGMTYWRDQGVVGWHRHPLGGAYLGGLPFVESVSVIPGPRGDQVWLRVRRTIGGVTRRTIERLNDYFDSDRRLEDAFFLDCGLSLDDPYDITGATQASPVRLNVPDHPFANGDVVRINDVQGMTELNDADFVVANAAAGAFDLNDADGAPIDGTAFAAYATGGEIREKVTSVSGAGHLAGETVGVMGDGADRGDFIVAGDGTVGPFTASAVVHVGLVKTARLLPMRLDAGAAGGTAQGKTKRVVGAKIRFLRSAGVKCGRDADNLEEVEFQTVEGGVNTAPLGTGDFQVDFPGDLETDGDILTVCDRMLPCTVTALMPIVQTEDE